jgi:hypothetical protein
MGLFSALFGKKEEGKKVKVRARFKNAKYFNKEIKRYDGLIETETENQKRLLAEGGTLRNAHYLALYSLYVKKTELLYSLGSNVGEVQSAFAIAIDYFNKGFSSEYQGYSQLVDATAKCVLFDVGQDNFKKLKDAILKLDKSRSIKEWWKPDTLIFFLLGEKKERESKFIAYQALYEVIRSAKKEAEESVKKYLEEWYKKQKGDPVYDSHLRGEGYSGYWSWEAAAVVKMMGLDDSDFKDSPYYPYDAVHLNERSVRQGARKKN